MQPVPPRAGAPATALPWRALTDLLRELPGLVSDRLHLLSLELKRNGMVATHIVALGLGAAVLLGTAWLALWAGVVVGLLQAGAHWAFAFGLVLLVNAGGAVWAGLRIKRLAPLLGLAATLRHLSFAPAPAGATDGRAESHDVVGSNAAPAYAGAAKAAPASAGVPSAAPADAGVASAIPASAGVPSAAPGYAGVPGAAPANAGVNCEAAASGEPGRAELRDQALARGYGEMDRGALSAAASQRELDDGGGLDAAGSGARNVRSDPRAAANASNGVRPHV